MRGQALATLCTVSLSLLCPNVANACWDGVLLQSSRMSAMIDDEDATWSVDEAHAYATQLAQIEALMPEGVTAAYDFGGFYFTDEFGLCETPYDEDAFVSWDELFDTVAEGCNSRPKEIEAARAIQGRVYTVQLSSSATHEAAEAAAMALNESEGESECGWHGFYEVGGFPAYNPCAHVVEAELDDGRVVHRVVVGAFTNRAAAEDAQTQIQAEIGREGMVRRL